jgi:predicted  nucleic acid-binding Zn-ribbon protein
LVKTLAAQKSAIKELKSKASRLDEIEEAQKSEAEKVADRLAKADAEVAGIPSKVCEALRAHLIKIHEIDQEDAELFLTATEPDLLLKQADRLVGQSGKRKNVVPREGRNPNPALTDPTRDFLRSINGQ